MEIGLDLVKNKSKTKNINMSNENINESLTPEKLKEAAETIGLDLTKNLPKRIYLI